MKIKTKSLIPLSFLLISCVFSLPVQSDTDETSYCFHHNSSFFNENSSPSCYAVDTSNETQLVNTPFEPGSIDAGSIVRKIQLYRDRNGKGESCTINGNRFNGNCNGDDWRWEARSVKFSYDTCRLVKKVVNLQDTAVFISKPSSARLPFAVGYCGPASDRTPYDRFASTVSPKQVCVADGFGDVDAATPDVRSELQILATIYNPRTERYESHLDEILLPTQAACRHTTGG